MSAIDETNNAENQGTQTDKQSYRFTLLVLFIVSMVTLGLEILLTRIFSVVLFASHSFMAISLTLLGTGSGAIIAYLGKKLGKDKLQTRQVIAMFMLAVAVVLCVWIMLQIEFVPHDIKDPTTGEVKKNLSYNQRHAMIAANPDLFEWWKLYAVIPLAFLPFLFAGYLQALIFRHAPKKFGTLYGIDLIAATTGSIFIPLLLYPFGLIGTISAVSIIALIPVIYAFATNMRTKFVGAMIAIPIVLIVVLTASGSFRVKHAAGFLEKDLVRDNWSPMARVALMKWGSRDMYVIDNGSRTFYVNKTQKYVSQYMSSMYTIPFELRKGGEALIIASGGGQEIVMANHFKMNVEAVEIARGIVSDIIHNKKDEPGNPYLLPNVKYHVADGRSVMMRSKTKYDVIEMLEVNFHTQAGQISQAWSPYFVFTQEAFSEYIAHLKDDGILCYTIFSRNRNPSSGGKARRIRSFIAGMKMAGLGDPEKNLVILARPYFYGHRTTVLAKKTPFTYEEISEIRQMAAGRKADIEVIFPNLEAIAGNLNVNLPEGEELQKTTRYVKKVRKMCRQTEPIVGLGGTLKTDFEKYRKMPINDDRPFMVRSGMRDKSSGKEKMIGRLYKTSLKVMGILALIFIVMPFIVRRPGGGERVRIDARLLLILICTGVGFMFVEMAGIFKFQLYLHHPTIAMIVVLSSMVLGAGLGSLHTGRIPQEKKESRIGMYSIAVVVVSSLLLIVIPYFGHGVLLWLPMFLLMPLTFLSFTALGFLLGHVVPLSIGAYAKDQSNLLAWCWAITVTGSVFGTVLASILSRDSGMFLVALLGLAAYIGVFLINVIGLPFSKKADQKA